MSNTNIVHLHRLILLVQTQAIILCLTRHKP